MLPACSIPPLPPPRGEVQLVIRINDAVFIVHSRHPRNASKSDASPSRFRNHDHGHEHAGPHLRCNSAPVGRPQDWGPLSAAPASPSSQPGSASSHAKRVSPPPRSISPSNPPAGQQSKIRRTIREGHSVREPCTGRQNLLPVPGSWAARFPDQHASRSKRHSASPASWALTLPPLFTCAPAFKQLVHTGELPQKAPHSPFPSQHSNSQLGTKVESRRSSSNTTTITHDHPFADSVRGDHSSTEAIATHSIATTPRETATRLVPPDDSRRPRSALPLEQVLPLFSTPYLDPDTSEPDDSFPRPPSGPWRSVCLGTSGAHPSSITPAFDRRFPRTIWTRYVSH